MIGRSLTLRLFLRLLPVLALAAALPWAFAYWIDRGWVLAVLSVMLLLGLMWWSLHRALAPLRALFRALSGSVNTFEANLLQGRLKFVGGAPSGSDDAPTFRKLGFSASRLQNLISGRLLAYATVRGQLALSNLDSTEQFRAGGPNGVRELKA